MKNALPEIEGNYYMIDSSGNKKQVKIENLAISINHPKNFHVVESEFEVYALSIENGCEEFIWEKIENT